MTSSLTTALHSLHLATGGKMVEFAGWELPVQFAGVMPEHLHTRAQASLFDVSHMGQVLVRPASGSMEDAAAALERLIPSSILGLAQHRQRYGLFTDERGGILDDLMVSHHGDRFLLVVNAARTAHDLQWLAQLDGVTVEHVTDRALLALQGPEAEAALATLIPSVTRCTFMDSLPMEWDGREVWVSRSGYTGEDGFEISVPDTDAERFARALLSVDGVLPAGLGARDSLRLEAGMPLYGHDLSPDVTPAQAALGWAVPKVRREGGSRSGGFPGADVVLAELRDGAPRVRRGLRPDGRAPIREGVPVYADDAATEPIATVTSGGFGPTVGGPIAMAMLPAGTGPTVVAELRGRRVPVSVVDLPFITPSYKR
ncbi:glycine cleavage system aminomethyltransferase GcvT [Tessaracoccus sp. Y1736]